jgi:ribonuclease Y
MTFALVALAFCCLVLVAWLSRRLAASEALVARSDERIVSLVRDVERLSADLEGKAREFEASRARAAESREADRIRVEREVEERHAAKALEGEARVVAREGALVGREKSLAEREGAFERWESALLTRSDELAQAASQAAVLVDERRARLEAVAGLSGEEARRLVIDEVREGARRDAAREAKRIEEQVREEAEKRAKRVIGIAIQRYAGEHVQERAATAVHLPSDELKGRIIGREGRNIRALQEACGADFIVDDTPETIVVSAFDPIRREVARLALERLVQDGRIQPSRIEEVVDKARRDVERGMDDAARAVLDELQLSSVHPEISKLLGRLRHRYSYAQNVLRHSVECAHLTALMAGELGFDSKQALRAGLLHDIGKAVSHEQEGGHAVIGGALARKFGEDPIVANAIACHHDDEPAVSVIGHLVTAADALSGARPGARREALESYVKRLHDLEAIASRFMGVERSFAIQAGREVRVMVEPGEVTDAEAALLAREISRSIEDELTYPGQVRVTVIRETRAVDYAK